MPYYSTKNIMEEVLVNKLRDKYLYNSHRSFKFRDNKFYSYNTVVGEFIDDILHIQPKTAKLGEFISLTTSKQINKLIKYCNVCNIKTNLNMNKNPNLTEIEFKEEDGHECPITYQIIRYGLKTKCGHIFEKVALKQWLRNKNQCPMCRTNL